VPSCPGSRAIGSLGTQSIGQGEVRTWAAKSQKLVFFVIGDFGTGQAPQYKIARVMWDEFQRRAKTDNPVRFILSVGDNIYGDITGIFGGFFHTGADDSDWTNKFFEPYQPLIARVPFFPTLGNHDGNETEKRADLAAILDNFPYSEDKPARYYKFTYGNLAEFFGLDSTKNTETARRVRFISRRVRNSNGCKLSSPSRIHCGSSRFSTILPSWRARCTRLATISSSIGYAYSRRQE
jgi:predicted MPP superfamily phosphohydrolase